MRGVSSDQIGAAPKAFGDGQGFYAKYIYIRRSKRENIYWKLYKFRVKIFGPLAREYAVNKKFY